MAGGYGCEFGDCQSQVNHLVTTLNPASTISLCNEHYAPGLIPLLAADLGVDPGKFYASIEQFIKRAAAAAVKDAARAAAAAEAAGDDDRQADDDDHQGDAADDQGGMSEVYGHEVGEGQAAP